MELVSLHGDIDSVFMGNDEYFGASALKKLGRKTKNAAKKTGRVTARTAKTTARVTSKVALAPVKLTAKITKAVFSKTLQPAINKTAGSVAKTLGPNITSASARNAASTKAATMLSASLAPVVGIGAVALQPVLDKGIRLALERAAKKFKTTASKVQKTALKKGIPPKTAQKVALKKAAEETVKEAEHAPASAPSSSASKASAETPKETKKNKWIIPAGLLALAALVL